MADLKGVEHREYDNKKLIHAVDSRTDTEKTHDLLKQFLDENQIDQVAGTSSQEDEDPIKSIEKRLAALKGTSSDPKNVPAANENVDDSTAAANLAKRVIHNRSQF